MRGITLFSLMAVGIIVFAGLCVGIAYTKYDKVTTTVSIDDGIIVTISGKEVTDGQTITIDKGVSNIKVEVASSDERYIGYAGYWTSGERTVTTTVKDQSIQYRGEFFVHFGHGNYKGGLTIAFVPTPVNYQTITMEFTIDSALTVTCNGLPVTSGQVIDYTDDMHITVTTKDGQKRDIQYSYYWNSSCEYGSGQGEEYNSTIEFTVENTAYFEHANGEIKIWF